MRGRGGTPPDPRRPEGAHGAIDSATGHEEGGEATAPGGDPRGGTARGGGGTVALPVRDLAAESVSRHGGRVVSQFEISSFGPRGL